MHERLTVTRDAHRRTRTRLHGQKQSPRRCRIPCACAPEWPAPPAGRSGHERRQQFVQRGGVHARNVRGRAQWLPTPRPCRKSGTRWAGARWVTPSPARNMVRSTSAWKAQEGQRIGVRYIVGAHSRPPAPRWRRGRLRLARLMPFSTSSPGRRGRRDHEAAGTHAEGKDAPPRRLAGQAVTGRGQGRVARGVMVEHPVDQGLGMLDAHAHGKGLGLQEHAAPMQEVVDVACRMARGQNHGVALHPFPAGQDALRGHHGNQGPGP